MELDYLPLLIPVFFAFIWVEHRLTRRKCPVYSFDNTILNLCCGIMERTVDLFYYGIMLFLFAWVQRNLGLFDIDPGYWWNWVLAAVLLDFTYYWYHRAGHEINVFWAGHVTHHQSEEFNFTVGFRNSNIPMIYKTLFWLPVPLLGFTPEMIAAGIIVSGLWQFLLHTTVFGRLGFLEKILVTPSAHRVHHGSNEQYLDKNYGAILIIWDRIFGTYAAEIEPVRYGLTKPFRGKQPLWAWFHYWADLIRASRHTPGFLSKMKIWVDKPGTIPESGNYTGSIPVRLFPEKQTLWYAVTQLAILVVALTALLVAKETLAADFKVVAGLWVFASAITICLSLEGSIRSWIGESFRHLCTAGVILSFTAIPVGWLLVPLGSAIWLSWLKYKK